MKIHFIGIGGIGVSALAQYYLSQGAEVSGSDLVASEITDFLKKKGARIKIGKHNAKNVPNDVDLVIYSPAITSDNPELQKIRKLQVTSYKLQVLSYPQALGELTKKYFTIAVSGTHGKSTTTAMIALILIKAGLNPTVIVGTKLKEFGNSNFYSSKDVSSSKFRVSRYLVIEADEWNASFLNYWPKIIVLTNIEREHLDYYKNIRNILKTYKEYVNHLKKDGFLVINSDDSNIFKIVNPKPQTPMTNEFSICKFSIKQKEVKKIRKILKIPGEHNIYNAFAALTVARVLNIPDKISFKALSEYKGAWRRFEISNRKIQNYKLKTINYKLINDYGHHPTEIKATLSAAREKFPKKKIWCVFQPHQYQRTFYLFKDFVKVFSQVPIDKIIITDIYDVAGRENTEIKKKVDSEKLVLKIKKSKVIYLPKEKIKKYLIENLRGGEVVIIMGAGDIYNWGQKLF